MRGGVDLIQLRDKTLDDDGIVAAARAFAGHDALFILNDRPDLVEACGADGVHVGQDDASPAEARAAVGADRIVGRSTHAPDQAAAADADPTSTTSRSAPCTRRRPSRAAPPRPALRRARGERGRKALVRDRRTGRRQRARGARARRDADRGRARDHRGRRTRRRRRGRCGTRWRVVSAPDAERRRRGRRRTSVDAHDRGRDEPALRGRWRAATRGRGRGPRRSRRSSSRSGPDERPLGLKLAVGLALLIAAANLIGAAAGRRRRSRRSASPSRSSWSRSPSGCGSAATW